ncbi:MAG: AAA family ATPase [Verrucomicrobiota bacterium]
MNNNIVSPIVNDTSSIRAGLSSVAAPLAATHEYIQPTLSPSSPPRARTLDKFARPVLNDPEELLKHRFLCRGGGLLLVGATGLGKSSLAMQLMIKWGLGQPVFGLEPARPIKSLLIQAENDDGDLAEMKFGVFNGLNLTEAEQVAASKNILVYQESSKTGGDLCSEVLDPLLKENKPDLLWLDPALAYIGGDMSSQKDVGKFLRNDLAPLLVKHNCGAVVIHHTNKVTKDPEKQMTDVSYLGAGSAEWINWPRCMLALRKTDIENVHELIAAKRGARLKWKTEDGESLSFKKYIGHSKKPDTICWNEMAIGDAEALQANNGKNAADVLKHVPQNALIAKDDLVKVCRQNGLGRNLVSDLIAELLDGDELFEVPVSRTGKRAKVLLSRQPEVVNPAVLLDACQRNSQGHYYLPNLPEQGKKTL